MRILVATDGSEAAGRAVGFAAMLGQKLRASLKIVHVISIDTLPMDQYGDYALREHVTLGDVLQTFAEQRLKEARKQAESLGVSEVETASPAGDVAETIIEAARQHEADMVVVGKRGRGRFSGLLLGSVSQKVASAAPCPVVVVP